MRYYREKKEIAFSLEKQYQNLIEEKKSIKSVRYFGYSIGFIGNAIVPPYAYQFGIRISPFIFKTDNYSLQVFIGGFFAAIATVALGALGANVCGEIFPATLQLMTDDPLTEIRVRTQKEKIFLSLGIGFVSLLAFISNVPGTYFTHKAYWNWSPFLALIFDFANQLAWSTVAAWSLYSVPGQIYQELENDFNFLEAENPRSVFLKKLDKFLKKMSFATESELVFLQQKIFPEDKFTLPSIIYFAQFESQLWVVHTVKSKLKKSIGLLGMIVGLFSIYFYYPVGKSSGSVLAKLLSIDDSSGFFENFMAVSCISSQATVAMISTKQVFELFYDRIKKLCTKTHTQLPMSIQEPLLPQRQTDRPSLFCAKVKAILGSLILFSFALIASSYRAEMTAEYVPENTLGLFLIALASVGATCLGYWSLENLAHKLTKKSDNSLKSQLMGRIGLLRLNVDQMDDKHFTALTDTAENTLNF